MNHIANPVTGEPDPSCCCFACVKRAVRRVMDAERDELERQALDRVLADMEKMPRGKYRGRRLYATCERLREFFS